MIGYSGVYLPQCLRQEWRPRREDADAWLERGGDGEEPLGVAALGPFPQQVMGHPAHAHR
jgi:hypothetical protein